MRFIFASYYLERSRTPKQLLKKNAQTLYFSKAMLLVINGVNLAGLLVRK